MSTARFAAIILAAGEGTRLNSALPGWPLIRYVTEALGPLGPAETVVVLGPGMEAVARAISPAKTAIQSPPRGTGDAVRAAKPALEARLAKGDIADVVVLFGDAVLLRPKTIEALLNARRRKPAVAIAAAGFRPPDPSPYGRFVLDRDGTLARIVEARDASPEERKIGLCNGGIMAIEARHLFDLVDKIGSDNAKREFYLTDIVGIARAQGLACRVAELPAEELIGVNTRAELAEAEAILQQRLRRRAMENGVT